jgi:KaiC/GvpD/RAD55 family RecA-like ATPase
MEEKVRTGIPGLDGMIEDGFEKNSVVMVAAGSGCGKTTFALQFLHAGAAQLGENGLFITLEEDKKQVFKHMLSFGWDFAALEGEGKIKVLEYPPTEIARFINEAGVIADMIEENDIKRVVVDSVTSLVLLSESEYQRRESFLKTMKMLKRWGVTCMLTSEAREFNGEVRARFGIEYLADGFITIHTIRKREAREQALEVVKMRGINHMKKMVPMKITDKGVVLYPEQHVFTD